MTSLKVLFASAEVAPVAKVGGLADVAGSLPLALHEQGHDIRVVMPAYSAIDTTRYGVSFLKEFYLDFMGKNQKASLNTMNIDSDVPLYLIGNTDYFNRPVIYGERDDLERFVFFAKAVMRIPELLQWEPDILHCQDWHSAISIPMQRELRRDDTGWSKCASLFTIHNLAYQGWFDDYFANKAGISQFLPPPHYPLRTIAYSTMALAIWHADIVSTVSPTYAREILTQEYGEKLDPVLRQRRKDLFGIVNGIDEKQYNPATDPYLAVNYDKSRIGLRIKNKIALQERCGFQTSDRVPLLGMVGRLAAQKGVDIISDALGPLLETTNIQFAFVGVGEDKLKQPLEAIAAKFPERVKLFFSFDQDVAQMVYGGCDMFLMPSLFEPCGLGQLIAMRYGAIPVVRHTGGLADTVTDVNDDLSAGSGFVFNDYASEALVQTVRRALNLFEQKDAWKKLILRVMEIDNSWKTSALKYQDLYLKARRKSRRTG